MQFNRLRQMLQNLWQLRFKLCSNYVYTKIYYLGHDRTGNGSSNHVCSKYEKNKFGHCDGWSIYFIFLYLYSIGHFSVCKKQKERKKTIRWYLFRHYKYCWNYCLKPYGRVVKFSLFITLVLSNVFLKWKMIFFVTKSWLSFFLKLLSCWIANSSFSSCIAKLNKVSKFWASIVPVRTVFNLNPASLQICIISSWLFL